MTVSKSIMLKKVTHRNRVVIFLIFNGRREWLSLVKSLKESTYSATHKSYYIPYTKEAFYKFKNLNIPHKLPNENKEISPIGHAQGVLSSQHKSDIASLKTHSSIAVDNNTQSTMDISSAKSRKLTVTFSNKYFQIKTHYDEKTVNAIKKLKKVWWNNSTKRWICYGSYENLLLIQKSFQCWNEKQLSEIEAIIQTYEKPCHVTIYQVPHIPHTIIVETLGYKKVHAPIIKISGRTYDKATQRWTIPYDNAIITQLKEDYKAYGIEVTDRVNTKEQKVTTNALSNVQRLQILLAKFRDSSYPIAEAISGLMMTQRYSWNTIKLYTIAVVKFHQWLSDIPINDCEQTDISNYLKSISGKKVSNSYLNIQVSALKFYFSKVIERQDISIQRIERPRTTFRLPRILSTQEVLRMIKVTDNIKHRNIIYAIYSSGLRLSELTSLKIEDISWDRNQVFVRGGKGKKDRVVMLSEHIKEFFKEYFHTYKPMVYLFESTEAGKRYANTSVQKVIKIAAKKAGITQKVTPHVLRHCFATHLHDNGISIAIIQELLGHKNLKTTLVYTHISVQQTSTIESPLDQLLRKSNTSNDKKVGI